MFSHAFFSIRRVKLINDYNTGPGMLERNGTMHTTTGIHQHHATVENCRGCLSGMVPYHHGDSSTSCYCWELPGMLERKRYHTAMIHQHHATVENGRGTLGSAVGSMQTLRSSNCRGASSPAVLYQYLQWPAYSLGGTTLFGIQYLPGRFISSGIVPVFAAWPA